MSSRLRLARTVKGDCHPTSLMVKLKDASGETWSYEFRSKERRRCDIRVVPGKVTTQYLLPNVQLSVDLRPGRESSVLYQDVTVAPDLITETGLYLADCRVGEKRRSESASARICVVSNGGNIGSDALTGFA